MSDPGATIAVAALFAVWLVVAVAICIRSWRASRNGKPTDIDWEDGSP